MQIALKRGPERLFVRIARRKVPVVVRRNARAQRLILRIDEAVGLPVLTLPTRTALAKGEDFLNRNLEWLEDRLRLLSPPVPFQDGCVIPFRGKPCRIEHRPGRGVVSVRREAGEYVMVVPGEAEFVARRVGDYLKRQARRDLEAAVARHAAAIRRKVTAIRMGDPKSRWGSCTVTGVLTFSWRLVLAPPWVLDYLAAHEVAHLREMNHGPKFWALVERLHPRYKAARTWLQKEGATLSPIGRGAP